MWATEYSLPSDCVSLNSIEENLSCRALFLGVTDFKAVKDSSTSDSPAPSLNLLIITSSAAGFFVFCIVTLCIIFTYRRKVSAVSFREGQNAFSWKTGFYNQNGISLVSFDIYW